MSLQSVPDLVRALRGGPLLSKRQADVLTRELQPRFSEVRALAGELIRRDWLTPYQINQLFLGRGRDLVLGPFVLMERIGEGAMGQVFKARHGKLNRVVALKVIRPERLSSPEAIRRFYREVQAAAALDHPNIVAAHDAGEVNGAYFLAMEYVEGADLGKVIKQRGPLDVSAASDYMRQVALGLEHAFEKGLVHRDIKPSNIIVQGAGRQPGALVKILDMGLARAEDHVSEGSCTLTQAQSVLGTPDFIAPEQARSAHDVDIRSDLYSLGCTFYYALTGQVPFPAEVAMEKLLKHYLEEPRPVEQLRPEVPVAVGQVVRRLMAKEPEKRYQTPEQLVRVLESVLGANVPVAIPVPMALPVGPAEPGLPADPSSDDDPFCVDDTLPDVAMEFDTSDSMARVVKARSATRRRRGLVPFAVAGVVIGLLVVLVMLLIRYALD